MEYVKPALEPVGPIKKPLYEVAALALSVPEKVLLVGFIEPRSVKLPRLVLTLAVTAVVPKLIDKVAEVKAPSTRKVELPSLKTGVLPPTEAYVPTPEVGTAVLPKVGRPVT